jgi:hypothetical protein
MQQACDFLSLHGYKLLWGPGAGIGHNLLPIIRANGLITEIFANPPHEQESVISSRGRGTATIRSGRKSGSRTRRRPIWGILPSDEMMK